MLYNGGPFFRGVVFLVVEKVVAQKQIERDVTSFANDGLFSLVVKFYENVKHCSSVFLANSSDMVGYRFATLLFQPTT